MDFSQNAKKVVDAATGRDAEEYKKRSARMNGLPPIVESSIYTGLGKPPRKPRKERRERQPPTGRTQARAPTR